MSRTRSILEMKPLAKGFFRLKIGVNNEETPIKFHQETVFKHRLHKGQTIDNTMWQTILDDDAYYTLLDYALARLAEHDHTRSALKNKLKRRQSNKALIERVLNQLETMTVLDEARALARLKEDFLQGPPKGPILFKQMLIRAEFDETVVHETLSSIDTSIWQERCEKYCRMALVNQKPETYLVRKRKIFTGALSKGFERDMIEPILEDVLKRAEPTDEAALLSTQFNQLKKRYRLEDAKSRQALIRALLRKGFKYRDIMRKLEGEGEV